MNRTDWKKLYRQIRERQQPVAIDANGRKYYVGQMGVKPVTGRAVLFSLLSYCRMFERHSSRLGTLRNARKYRLELQEAVRLEISVFGQADQPGLRLAAERFDNIRVRRDPGGAGVPIRRRERLTSR